MNDLPAALEIRFTGTVVSHESDCHCVVIDTPQRRVTLQDDYARFMQQYNEAKGLRIGAAVHPNRITEWKKRLSERGIRDIRERYQLR